jgi:hypothetical protein
VSVDGAFVVKIRLGPLSPPPSAYTEDVTFSCDGNIAELRCTYERDGSLIAGGLRFRTVRAYRFSSEGHCTPWHVEDAYDELVEVLPSDWVAELLAADTTNTSGRRALRHFLIFIDGSGAYEVVAEECTWLQERSAS